MVLSGLPQHRQGEVDARHAPSADRGHETGDSPVSATDLQNVLVERLDEHAAAHFDIKLILRVRHRIGVGAWLGAELLREFGHGRGPILGNAVKKVIGQCHKLFCRRNDW